MRMLRRSRRRRRRLADRLERFGWSVVPGRNVQDVLTGLRSRLRGGERLQNLHRPRDGRDDLDVRAAVHIGCVVHGLVGAALQPRCQHRPLRARRLALRHAQLTASAALVAGDSIFSGSSVRY